MPPLDDVELRHSDHLAVRGLGEGEQCAAMGLVGLDDVVQHLMRELAQRMEEAFVTALRGQALHEALNLRSVVMRCTSDQNAASICKVQPVYPVHRHTECAVLNIGTGSFASTRRSNSRP